MGPAGDQDRGHRQQPEHHAQRLEAGDVLRTQQVQAEHRPDQQDLAGQVDARAVADRQQDDQVAERGHGDGVVADPRRQPVQGAGQEAHVAPQRGTDVVVRRGQVRMAAGQPGEGGPEQDRQQRAQQPGQRGDPADFRQRGREQEEAGADHVVGDQEGRQDRADLAWGSGAHLRRSRRWRRGMQAKRPAPGRPRGDTGVSRRCAACCGGSRSRSRSAGPARSSRRRSASAR